MTKNFGIPHEGPALFSKSEDYGARVRANLDAERAARRSHDAQDTEPGIFDGLSELSGSKKTALAAGSAALLLAISNGPAVGRGIESGAKSLANVVRGTANFIYPTREVSQIKTPDGKKHVVITGQYRH